MKTLENYSYLLYWICDDKIFETCKDLYCKSFVPYFQQIERML